MSMLFMSGAYPNLFDPNNKPQSPELTGESVLDFLLFNAGADAWLRSVIKWNASAQLSITQLGPYELFLCILWQKIVLGYFHIFK